MGLSNYPPGVTESMIPGNRPEDILFDEVCNETCGKCPCIKVCMYANGGEEERCPCIKKAMDAAHEPPWWMDDRI
jgi:hypothetical protein